MQHKMATSGFAKELKTIAIFFVAAVIIMKIAYYKEGIVEVIRVSASLFWLFVIPGYAMTLYWKEYLGFIERAIVGTVAAISISSITSYYLGLLGLKLQNQTILLPLAIIVLSFAACLKLWARKNLQKQQ